MYTNYRFVTSKVFIILSFFNLPLITIHGQCVGEHGSIENIICYADELKQLLTETQIAQLEQPYSYTNARNWSNLPVGFTGRVGIELGSLSTTQLEAAYRLIAEISGTIAFEGYEEFLQIIYADGYLGNSANGYGEGYYYLGFNGTPSATDLFSIKVGGHHLEIQNTYNKGVLVGATPHFKAVEPISFSYGGEEYSPMIEEIEAFRLMLESFTSAQAATAKLSNTFSDIILGANNMGANNDWQFPTTKVGINVSELDDDQKDLVLDAIKTYVSDIDDTNSYAILSQYEQELNDTYVAYTGSSSFTSTNDYVRIDGPSVWIELSVQNGVIFNGVHYHSIWRDHKRDFGGQGSSHGIYDTSIGLSTSVTDDIKIDRAMITPNPTQGMTKLTFESTTAAPATIVLWSVNGQKLKEIYTGSLQLGYNEYVIDVTDIDCRLCIASITSQGVSFPIKFLKI